MRRSLKIVLLFVFCSAFIARANQPVFEIDHTKEGLNIEQFISSYKDDNNLTIATISKLNDDAFTPFSWQKVPNDSMAYWLKIVMHNNSGKDDAFIIGTSYFDFLTCYTNNNGTWNVQYAGNNFSNDNKSILFGSNSYFEIELKQNETQTVYFLATNENKLLHQYSPLPFSVYSRPYLLNQQENQKKFNYFFLGAILIMTLYNLALFVQLRTKMYSLYVLNNLVIILFVLAQTGMLSAFLFSTFKYHEHLILILGNIAFIFYVLFSKEVLNLKNHQPKLDKVLKYMLLVWPLPLLFVFANQPLIAVGIGGVGALVVYTLIIRASIRAIKSGNNSAKYFLIGNIFYYTGIVISILQIGFILPPVMVGLTAINYVEIGSIIELSLFSLMLGYQINEMRQELVNKELEKEKLIRLEEQRLAHFIVAKNEELEQKVKRRTESLERSNEENKQMLLEKEILLKEIHHRVKNNLQLTASLLNLQSKKTDNKEIKRILNDGQMRLKSMSLIHQNLYQNNTFSQINLENYLQQLIRAISFSFDQKEKPITINLNADVNMKLDNAIPVGLIANELITNAYKHAFEGRDSGVIDISITRIESNDYCMEVRDNGVGMDLKLIKNKTLGVSLVEMLTTQMGGKLEVGIENGTWFKITFPEHIE